MSNLKTSFSKNLKQFVMLITLMVIIIFFQVLTRGTLLKPMNVFNLINQNAYVVVLAVGMLMCILTGGNVDLSVGSVVAFVGACAGTMMITWKWDPYLSTFLCLLAGIVIGRLRMERYLEDWVLAVANGQSAATYDGDGMGFKGTHPDGQCF